MNLAMLTRGSCSIYAAQRIALKRRAARAARRGGHASMSSARTVSFKRMLGVSLCGTPTGGLGRTEHVGAEVAQTRIHQDSRHRCSGTETLAKPNGGHDVRSR